MSEIETEPVSAAAPPAPPVGGAPAISLFAGISAAIPVERVRGFAAVLAADASLREVHVTLAHPGSEAVRTAVAPGIDLLAYPLPNVDGGAVSPWGQRAAAQVALLALAVEEQAAATLLLDTEASVLTPSILKELSDPVLARSADLVIATYPHPPFDALLNTGILAPLTRALYGKRIHFPLAPDFALSPRMAARLAVSTHSRSGTAATVLWPGTVAAGIDATVVEVNLGIQLPIPVMDMELREVVAQLVGAVFAEMETHAPLWQRIRATTAAHVLPQTLAAQPAPPAPAAGTIDTAPMIQSFLLASRNLQDVWGLVLPPVTLLDLKRITLMPVERFRLPDELWVRIVYDFALAYRLRTINRTHLLGALTPLYLGWVASFIRESTTESAVQTPGHAERLARAFEEGKPYLVRRWRWPDRFNP